MQFFNDKNIDIDQCCVLTFADRIYYIFVTPGNEAFENDEVQTVMAAYGIQSAGYADDETDLPYFGE